MKIIHAVWEQRNLGVDTVEIEVDQGDTLEALDEALDQYETEYTVVKIPPARYELNQALERRGFSFIECLIKTGADRAVGSQENPLLEKSSIRKRYDQMECTIMDDGDLEELYRELNRSIFTTDRVYLDPHFSKEAAAERYVNWIKDELERGAIAYKVSHREKSIGFFVHKKNSDNQWNGLLMGLYKDYQGSGYGILLREKEREFDDHYGSAVIGSISSNNMNRLRLAFSQPGSTLMDLKYVYIKHAGG